jgi:hypothetical protein
MKMKTIGQTKSRSLDSDQKTKSFFRLDLFTIATVQPIWRFLNSVNFYLIASFQFTYKIELRSLRQGWFRKK